MFKELSFPDNLKSNHRSPKITPKKLQSFKSLSPVTFASPLSPSCVNKKNFDIKSRIRPSKTLEDGLNSSTKQGHIQDLYLKKFELVSMKLEKLLDEVHAKYNFDRNCTFKSLSPKAKLPRWSDFNDKKSFEPVKNSEEGEKESEINRDSTVFNKPLNKLAIRSKLFKHTTKWISESPK